MIEPRFHAAVPFRLPADDIELAWTEAEKTIAWHNSRTTKHLIVPDSFGMSDIEARFHGYLAEIGVGRHLSRRPLLHRTTWSSINAGDLEGGVEVRFSYPKRPVGSGLYLKIRPCNDGDKMHRPWVLAWSLKTAKRDDSSWDGLIAGWIFGDGAVRDGHRLRPEDEHGPAYYAIYPQFLRPIDELAAFGPAHDFNAKSTGPPEGWDAFKKVVAKKPPAVSPLPPYIA